MVKDNTSSERNLYPKNNSSPLQSSFISRQKEVVGDGGRIPQGLILVSSCFFIPPSSHNQTQLFKLRGDRFLLSASQSFSELFFPVPIQLIQSNIDTTPPFIHVKTHSWNIQWYRVTQSIVGMVFYSSISPWGFYPSMPTLPVKNNYGDIIC